MKITQSVKKNGNWKKCVKNNKEVQSAKVPECLRSGIVCS